MLPAADSRNGFGVISCVRALCGSAALAAILVTAISCDEDDAGAGASGGSGEAQGGGAAADTPEATGDDGDDTSASATHRIDDVPYYTAEPLAEGDLEEASLRELSIRRNTIYARAGNEFATPWLREYFEAQPWYDGGGLDDDMLTPTDRENAVKIRSIEQALDDAALERRWRVLWDSEKMPTRPELSP